MKKRNLQICCMALIFACLFFATPSFAVDDGVKILSTKNKVDIVRAKGGGSPASEGMLLHEGDVLKTFANGISILQMTNGDMITIMQFSELVIGKQNISRNSSKRSFDISKGRLYAKVLKLKKGDSFQISTPTAVAVVHGTLFSVAPGNIKCVEGAVSVSQVGNVYEVGEMQEVNIGPGGITEPEVISNVGLKEIYSDINAIEESFGGMTFTKQAVESVEKMAVTRPGLKLGQPFNASEDEASEGEASEDESNQLVLNGKGSKTAGEESHANERDEDSHHNGSNGEKDEHESNKPDGDKEKPDNDASGSEVFGNTSLMDERTILSIVTENAGTETPEAGNMGN